MVKTSDWAFTKIFLIFDLNFHKYLLKIQLDGNGNASSDWVGHHCGSYNVVIGRSFNFFLLTHV